MCDQMSSSYTLPLSITLLLSVGLCVYIFSFPHNIIILNRFNLHTTLFDKITHDAHPCYCDTHGLIAFSQEFAL